MFRHRRGLFGSGLVMAAGAVAVWATAVRDEHAADGKEEWKTAKRRMRVAYSEAKPAAQQRHVAFSPHEFRKFSLSSVSKITPNTSLFRFALQSPEHETGLTVASCVLARAEIDGKQVVRPYTPTSLNTQRGFVDFVVKRYPAPSGLMSRHIHELRPGVDSLEIKGPFKKFDYRAGMYQKIGMVAGGTGIAPMLQVIREVLANPADTTELFLICANVTEEDILLREELDALAYLYPRFKIFHTLDRPGPEWKGGSGYVSLDMIRSHLPGPSDDILILVCGPKGMIEHMAGAKEAKDMQGPLGGLLREAGFDEDMVFKF